jgi:signal transduction histidine kinase
VFFGGCRAAADDLLPVVEIVARDIGWTLDQALAADRAREMAISAERIRVARDLHDGVLQSLTGIRLELQASAADDSTPPVLSERLVDMERALALEQRELRRFIHGLRPAALAGAGDSALADVLDEVRRRIVLEWRAPITIAIHPNDLVLPAPVDRDVCHMVHEGIVNALKHGSPSRVSVDIRMTHETLRIAITDDGRGFPFHGKQDHTELASANTGPASLRERVEALGGRIAVESAANGSCVELFVPVGAAVG